MKKYFLLLVSGILYLTGAAQHFPGPRIPHSMQAPPAGATDKTGGAIEINYHASDLLLYGGGNYKTALWPMNMHYSAGMDSMVTYGIVAFDTVVSINNAYAYAYDQIGQPTLDSIWIRLGHENNSGTADTLIVDVVRLDTVQFPTLTILWADTLIFATGQSAGNNWQNTLVLTLAPQLLLPVDTAMGVRFRYYGALADTFGIVAGFGTDNQACGSFPETRAVYSHFYPNSYAYWTTYQLLLPTRTLGDLYYDCNGNFQFDTLTDGANYIQNWDVAVQLSSPEIGYPAYAYELPVHIFPNPGADWLQITAEPDVLNGASLSLYTPDGRVLTTMQGTGAPVQLNLANFANGIYLVEIKKDNRYAVRKIIVQH